MEISHVSEQEVPWPVCLPSSWVKTVFEQTNGVLLLGRPLCDEAAWAADLAEFWNRFQHVCRSHACFTDHAGQLHVCVPYMLHGDEGRGAAKRAIMVCSWQSVMQEPGGHTFLSRYLTAVIPAARYASETTFHQISSRKTCAACMKKV